MKTHCMKGRIEAVLLSEQGNVNLRKECVIKLHVCDELKITFSVTL
jgi:hypothetical protein